MVKIKPCGRVFLCQRKNEIKSNPLLTTTSLFLFHINVDLYYLYRACIACLFVFVVFQFNVTLNDIQSPQWYGGTFMSIYPKPGGR